MIIYRTIHKIVTNDPKLVKKPSKMGAQAARQGAKRGTGPLLSAIEGPCHW